MTFSKLSKKQKMIFRWCYDSRYKAVICDGAVRSGKTVCMAASFILWAMRAFGGAVLSICGKTVQSAERNIISQLSSIADITAYFKLSYSRTDHLLTVSGNGRTNRFYVFGGKDESSYALIQGITLSGVLLDEVALMPESFVNQAIARTLSVPEAKIWFNCNPGNPHHWFYKNWVLGADEKNALRLHFLMSDNPILSAEQIADAEKLYSGVFKKRYIDGLWAAAEGVIYTQIADDIKPFILSSMPEDIIFGTIGIDFGGNGSANAAVFTGFSKSMKRMVVLDEYYRKEIITPSQLEEDLCGFIIRCKNSGVRLTDVYCDSAEQTLIRGLKTACAKQRLAVNISNARKSSILGRIRFTNAMASQGRLFIMPGCRHLIDALQSAVWDSKKADDVRLDDGNYNIDSLDAFEYSFEHLINDMIERR